MNYQQVAIHQELKDSFELHVKPFMLEAHNKQDVPLNFMHFFVAKALTGCHWLLSMETGLIYFSMMLLGSIS